MATVEGLGVGPWGSTPWGGGVGSGIFEVVAAVAIRENVIRVTFSQPPYFSGIADSGDASDPRRFQLLPVAGTFGLDGLPTRLASVVRVDVAVVDGTNGEVLDLTLDRPMSPWPSRYSLVSNGLKSQLGSPIAGGSSFELVGVQAGLRSNQQDLTVAGRDIANPQTLQSLFDPIPNAANLPSSVLGTYQADGTGDVAHDEGLVGYRKRVIRRLMTRKNSFAHLPGYGAGIGDDSKRLALPGLRDAKAHDAEQQILEEPETTSVKVRVVVRGDVTIYQVAAFTKLGPASFNVPVPKG